MTLDQWTRLSDVERMSLRQKWARQNRGHNDILKQLYSEAVQHFTQEYRNHPLVSEIESVDNFAPLSKQWIPVRVFAWSPQKVSEIPEIYATFVVKQYPETIRYHIVERYGVYAVYEALYTEGGRLEAITREPVAPVANNPDALKALLRQLCRTEDSVLEYDNVPKHTYGIKC